MAKKQWDLSDKEIGELIKKEEQQMGRTILLAELQRQYGLGAQADEDWWESLVVRHKIPKEYRYRLVVDHRSGKAWVKGEVEELDNNILPRVTLMTNEEKQKLKEKMAEFAGFEWREMIRLWNDPIDGLVSSLLPNFTESLDACREWLFPKLDKLTIEYDAMGEQWWARVNGEYDAVGTKPSLVVCLAIEKLIDGRN